MAIELDNRVPEGAVNALLLDGGGGAQRLPAGAGLPEQPYWLHLDYSQPSAQEWLAVTPLLHDEARDSLLGESNRPKLVKLNGGLLLTLRTINSNAGQRPEQMVALRFYIDEHKVISTRRRHVGGVVALQQQLAGGHGPLNCGDWLVAMCEALTEETGDHIDDLQERIAQMEEDSLAQQLPHRRELAQIRRQLILLRRYLAPQRDLYARLAKEKITWLEADDQRRLEEIGERLGRWLDDLNASLVRADMMSEEISAHHAEQLSRRSYLMSLFAMVFLPVSALTGLFGVNLGGIPGGESPWGFALFCALMLALVLGLGVWLWRRRWL